MRISSPCGLFSFKVFMASEWKIWVSGAIFSLFLASVLLSGWPDGLVPDVKYPFIYSGDGLSHSWFIKNVMEGWIFNNERLGYPFGSHFLDYPGSDSGNHLILKLLGVSSGSYVFALNFYILLGFPLVFVASYWFSRSVGLDVFWASAAGLIFTFLPFHFLRLGHLFYTLYFVVPVFYYLAFLVFTPGSEVRIFELSRSAKAFFVVLLIMLSSFGVYYALFGIIVVFISALLSVFSRRDYFGIKLGALICFLVSFGVLLNVAPNLQNAIVNGGNPEVAQRSSVESEVYGFKLVQLILPRINHRWGAFSEVTEKYNSSFPLVNENFTSSLGVVGSVGFILVLFNMFTASLRKERDDRLVLLSVIVFVLFLFGTIGGLGAVFSSAVSSSIRGWNRISVFVAFGAIVVFFVTIQSVFDKIIVGGKKSIKFFAVSFVCLFGVLDQTASVCLKCNEQRRDEYLMNVGFFREVESKLPKSAAIYQFPYIPFPESSFKPWKMGEYDNLIGFLHSNSLRWSAGAMRGREGDMFFRSLSAEPLKKQIEVAKKLGFSAVYVDRRGYENADAVVDELSVLLGSAPVAMRADGEIVLFKMDGDSVDYSGLSSYDIMRKVNYIVDRDGKRYDSSFSDGVDLTRPGLPSFVKSIDGLSGSEPWGRWSDGRLSSSVRVKFFEPLPSKFNLRVWVVPFEKNPSKDLTIRVGGKEYLYHLRDGVQEISLPIDVGGEPVDLIEFKPGGSVSPRKIGLGEDHRKLGVGFVKLLIEGVAE